MSRPPRYLRSAHIAWIAVSLGALAALRATAQTPSNTWIATANGNWSTGSNWDTGTAPVAGATTTILQFNASGTTAYTANNDISDPFPLLGLQFKGTAGTAITLTGGTLTLSQSGTAGFINQNGSGAVTINNNLTLTNASSATDMAIGGTGSGTVTLNGVISGVGGLQFINVGGATVVISNPANAFTATGLGSPTAFLNPFNTVMVTATSGGGAAATSPLGNTNVVFQSGTLAIAPAATGGDVTVGLASGKNITFLAGGTVALTKGGNTSLTFTVNALTYTLTGNSSGTMLLAPASGIAALGTATGERLVPTLAPTVINGVLAPTNVGQASQADSTGDYLTFGAAGFTGVSQFQGYTNYSTPGGSFTPAGPTEISNVTAATTASAPTVSTQALRVTGTTLTINAGSTVTVAGATFYSGRPNTAGLLLNNGTVAGGGTLDFGGGEMDLYAGAGTSTISAQVTSTNASTVGPAIIKFGPGNLVLSNPANSFATGAVYTLYGGSLGIIGPGGTNQSAALGTGNHTFVMRGGAFGVTGGDYAPTNGNTTTLSPSFLLAAGGGGFFVDGTSTLTLAQAGQLSAVAQSGPLYKTGTGTLVLGSAYNLNGMAGVLINQGQLQVNAALTGTISGTAALNVPVPTVVNNTGTLAGTGAVPGNVVVKSGGTIAPGVGNTIGTFTAGGANFQPGGTYKFKYNPGTSAPTAGTDNDLLASTAGSVLDLSGLSSANRFLVNLVPAVSATPPGSPVTYTAGNFTTILLPVGVPGPDVTSLFTFTGAFLGTPTATANSGVLTFQFTPVPEPGLVLLACAAAAGLVARRRTGSRCTAK